MFVSKSGRGVRTSSATFCSGVSYRKSEWLIRKLLSLRDTATVSLQNTRKDSFMSIACERRQRHKIFGQMAQLTPDMGWVLPCGEVSCSGINKHCHCPKYLMNPKIKSNDMRYWVSIDVRCWSHCCRMAFRSVCVHRCLEDLHLFHEQKQTGLIMKSTAKLVFLLLTSLALSDLGEFRYITPRMCAWRIVTYNG